MTRSLRAPLGQHQVAIGSGGFQPHQLAHRIGGEGHPAEAEQVTQALGCGLSGQVHRQFGRQVEHLQGAVGIDPQQQQGIGVGRAGGGGAVDGGVDAIGIAADQQQGDGPRRIGGQAGRADLRSGGQGPVRLRPEQAQRGDAHHDAGAGDAEQPQGPCRQTWAPAGRRRPVAVADPIAWGSAGRRGFRRAGIGAETDEAGCTLAQAGPTSIGSSRHGDGMGARWPIG